jgi:serine protease Do
MYGNIVGIVNIKIVYGAQIDNLGFAISIDEAQPVISELVEHGLVSTRAMLGITAMELNSYNSALYGFDEEEGLFVETVRPGSPAAQSGLSRGDIIVKVDGEDVATIADLQNIVRHKNVGDDITVTIVRYNNYGESNEMTLTFELIGAW